MDPRGRAHPASDDDERIWRISRVESALVWVFVVAMPTIFLVAGSAPVGVALLLVAVGALFALSLRRPFVRITADELVVRNVILTTRIPRAEVESAYFTYYNLVIRKRNGDKIRSRLTPKWSSTELSGDEPPPDSPAYQITRWASTGRS